MNSHDHQGFRLLSNGKLRSHVHPGGQGGLFYDWVALTRHSEASPLANGPMLHVRCGDQWSLAENIPAEHQLTVQIDVAIPSDVNLELRKITITNRSEEARSIELTSYAEIALNHPLGDAGHPAFSKLFVQTSIAGEQPVMLARRRPRGLNENWPWIAQTLLGSGSLSWESNRASFLGRGRTPLDPAAMDDSGPLSGETGNVLDPVMAWRTSVALKAGESKSVWLLTSVADNEAEAHAIIRSVEGEESASLLLKGAHEAETARLVELNISPADAIRYQAMAAEMLSGTGSQPAPESMAGSEAVHRFPLSWEEIRVIATGEIHSAGTSDLFAAAPYWRSLGLKVKLFLMTDATSQGNGPLPPDIVIVDPRSFTSEELGWWLSSAQLICGEEIYQTSDALEIEASARPTSPQDSLAEVGEDLLHFNGHGGFSQDGREYVIPLSLKDGRLTLPPMPWVNILANPEFGCMVTERGAGYTWSRNSQANRLTPWSNDPMTDAHGEAFYLRDDGTGFLWSPLPGPCPPRSAFVVRHGFGRTRFASSFDGLTQSVEIMVAPDAPVKLVSIRLRNGTSAERRLTFASYQKLILGSSPDRHHATLAWVDENGIQHAMNPRAGDFAGGRVFSFVDVHGAKVAVESTNQSSSSFLGTGGISSPSSLAGDGGEARGFGLDACFSRSLSFTIPSGEEIEIVVGFGEAMSEEAETSLLNRHRRPNIISRTNEAIDSQWNDLLGKISIKTPLPEIDLMVNGWLLYQNLACRIWGRSAFYQSGGAYGFRDQLQDSGALAALHPELMRSQILLHAAQQFPEGDVTHWWHPAPMNRGMRTNFSDDLLWLPYLTDHYLQVTGDLGVLEENLKFIEGPLLGPDEDEEYMKPEISSRDASVFEHCCLAIDHSLTTGDHGLPLIGIGDWNDGMSRIGREGRGESVWMGFFLYTILGRWIPLCEERGQTVRAKIYQEYRDDLLIAINDAGWDGEWYRRAYYDDGTPLGTHTDDECRIDALAQAWAVISNAANAERTKLCLDSLAARAGG